MRVLVIGANGRMGQEVIKIVNLSKDSTIVAGIDKENIRCEGYNIYNDCNSIKEKIDVIIDFSLPKVSMQVLEYASKEKIPMVIATTGFSDEELKTILNYSKTVPIFKSNNMSYNISLMMDIISKLAIQLEDNDIEIIETHHKNKVDSPSGTALMLADSMNEALDKKMNYIYDRTKERKPREKNEIGIHAIRGGTEVGRHTVSFFGDNETFEITHNVTSRSIFAKGSLKAARFLVKKTNGIYNMKDLINEELNEI